MTYVKVLSPYVNNPTKFKIKGSSKRLQTPVGVALCLLCASYCHGDIDLCSVIKTLPIIFITTVLSQITFLSTAA